MRLSKSQVDKVMRAAGLIPFSFLLIYCCALHQDINPSRLFKLKKKKEKNLC